VSSCPKCDESRIALAAERCGINRRDARKMFLEFYPTVDATWIPYKAAKDAMDAAKAGHRVATEKCTAAVKRAEDVLAKRFDEAEAARTALDQCVLAIEDAKAKLDAAKDRVTKLNDVMDIKDGDLLRCKHAYQAAILRRGVKEQVDAIMAEKKTKEAEAVATMADVLPSSAPSPVASSASASSSSDDDRAPRAQLATCAARKSAPSTFGAGSKRKAGATLEKTPVATEFAHVDSTADDATMKRYLDSIGMRSDVTGIAAMRKHMAASERADVVDAPVKPASPKRPKARTEDEKQKESDAYWALEAIRQNRPSSTCDDATLLAYLKEAQYWVHSKPNLPQQRKYLRAIEREKAAEAVRANAPATSAAMME
jgi:hypothetical protein